ncbi:hypothetical protein SAMN06296952_0505 [Oscillospiraceae bacterium]|jgi:hypothetical protein|nr:hypothetical protein SAMN06296952_0505 [Oscillospiraceae bacterium]
MNIDPKKDYKKPLYAIGMAAVIGSTAILGTGCVLEGQTTLDGDTQVVTDDDYDQDYLEGETQVCETPEDPDVTCEDVDS